MKSSSPLGFTLHGVDTAHPYLASRGIEARTAVQFGVGFYRGSGIFVGRLVIPVHNERGELVAYCGRAVDGSQPRYRFPSNRNSSSTCIAPRPLGSKRLSSWKASSIV